MGKYVLVTGASGGIGQAVALKLASLGFNLYLHFNRNETSIKDLLNQLEPFGGDYTPIQANLEEPDGYKKICSQIFSLDAIVHCSGNTHYGLLVDVKQEDIESLMRVHVMNPLMITKELLPKLIQKRSGNVILISSIWGQTGAACEVVYSTAKGAQISFVKALSKEVALNGVRVNAIAPGAVETPMMSQFSEEDKQLIEYEIPMGRLGVPEEIANGVKFLLSDESSYITGQVLSINGGWYT
ncbi:SDR family oxidoreductase [Neobacillus sp. DY30]|uniref:elongation factor P 5-aminopentanone reductase n=1 Tax=Neobacillus sp. DY30 TaxID=3047871 RepID=UPI0024C014DB|nr:SDR family oxidoreductase [Neobacillus sp. DY30]WHY02402.1 SDR family oxidoreductase [Neobacillus sp. DY30]